MPILDRQRQRREYVRKKTGIMARGFIAGVLLLCSAIGTMVAAIGTCLTFLAYLITPDQFEDGRSVLSLHILVTFLCGCLWRLSYLATNRTEEQASLLSYVPAPTFDTLPAEEVLVRAAGEPATEQSTVLLRAVDETTDAPAEQLLRASTEEKRRQ